MTNFTKFIKVKDFGLSIALTMAAVGFIEFLRFQADTDLVVVIFILPLVYVSYAGGFAAGVVAAGVFGIYIHLVGIDITGAIIVNAVLLAVVAMLNWLLYDARVQALNGSFQKILDALSTTRRLKRDWNKMSDEERLTEIIIIEDRLGNSAANVIGWRELRQQTEENKAVVIGEKKK